MNITFLIGNGFDIAAGLKTKYSDFLKVYLKKPSKTEVIKTFKESIKKDLEDDTQNWVDFELGFGRYLEAVDSENEIVEIYKDCIEHISSYISKENKKIDFALCEKMISDNYIRDLKNFYAELPPVTQRNFMNVSNIKNVQENINFNFVNFNYTHILENCLDVIVNTSMPWDERKIGSNTYTTSFGKDLYVHGNIKKSDILFGLNDESQVKFKGSLSPATKRKIIKPVKNNALSEGTNAAVEKLLNSTQVFCLFGVSLGETDLTWWNKIGGVFKKHATSQIIFYVYEPTVKFDDFTANDARLDAEENYKDLLLLKLGLDTDTKKNARSRVHVIVNSKIFQHNLAKETRLLKRKGLVMASET